MPRAYQITRGAPGKPIGFPGRARSTPEGCPSRSPVQQALNFIKLAQKARKTVVFRAFSFQIPPPGGVDPLWVQAIPPKGYCETAQETAGHCLGDNAQPLLLIFHFPRKVEPPGGSGRSRQLHDAPLRIRRQGAGQQLVAPQGLVGGEAPEPQGRPRSSLT